MSEITEKLTKALNTEELNFLKRVRDGVRLPFATRAEDAYRQRCRRLGLVEIVMNPRRWQITDAGRAALTNKDSEATHER